MAVMKSLISDPDRVLVRLIDENNTILGSFKDRITALQWVDNLLESVTKHRFSLMGHLNQIQADTRYDMKRHEQPDPFPYKDWIPISVDNLLLKEYNLQLQEVWDEEGGEEESEEG